MSDPNRRDPFASIFDTEIAQAAARYHRLGIGTTMMLQWTAPERVLSPPAPGKWRLAMWDGGDHYSEMDVSGVGFGLADGINGEVELHVVSKARASEVAPFIATAARRVVTEADVLAVAQNARALPDRDAYTGKLAARIVGPFQIVVGPDVRVVRQGECPPTHLPVYATMTPARATDLIDLACAGELQGNHGGTLRTAPEALYGVTLDAAEALSDRIALLDAGRPTPSVDFIARAERAAAVERGDVTAADAEPPPEPPAGSVERAVYDHRSGFRVLTPEDFYGWAVDRGLAAPAPLDRASFPGSMRAICYPGGWFALVYRDHVRVGQLVAR